MVMGLIQSFKNTRVPVKVRVQIMHQIKTLLQGVTMDQKLQRQVLKGHYSNLV